MRRTYYEENILRGETKSSKKLIKKNKINVEINHTQSNICTQEHTGTHTHTHTPQLSKPNTPTLVNTSTWRKILKTKRD